MWPFSRDGPCPPAAESARGIEYTLLRLDCLIDWYEVQAHRSSLSHKALRILTITAAALITVLAAASVDSTYLAALGGVIVVAQGIDELFQFQAYWVKDAESKEVLKREKSLYLARAGPYAPGKDATDPDRLLAETVESVAGKELDAWVKSLSRGDRGTPSS